MGVKKKPTYRVYVVEDIDAENSFWTLIGTAFAHEDMKGMNVLLKALPIDGRLVLRRTMIAIKRLSMRPALGMFHYTGALHQLHHVPHSRGNSRPILRRATDINAGHARLQQR